MKRFLLSPSQIPVSIVVGMMLIVACSILSAETLSKEQPAWSLNNDQNVLEPFRAIIREKVFHKDFLGNKGYVSPKNETDSLIIIFFKLGEDTLSVEDLNWMITDQNDHSYHPVGFGYPWGDEPVRLEGKLTEGKLSSFVGKDPLVALIFVLPKEISNLNLVDPQQNKGILQLSADWLPSEENTVTGYSFEDVSITSNFDEAGLVKQ